MTAGTQRGEDRRWPSTKAKRVKAALLRAGWRVARQHGTSHAVLDHPQRGTYLWAFHDSEEIGPRMMGRIAKATGLTQEDL
jgi:predicted RNA binding protein YcfA (HicA-like mRNA interferase family)